MQRLTPYLQRSDERGSFTGLINDRGFEEINVLTTRAGYVRGGHYHRDTVEFFYIVAGTLTLKVMDLTGESLFEGILGPGEAFLVHPQEIHWVRAESDVTWFNALSRRLDAEAPDFHSAPDGISWGEARA